MRIKFLRRGEEGWFIEDKITSVGDEVRSKGAGNDNNNKGNQARRADRGRQRLLTKRVRGDGSGVRVIQTQRTEPGQPRANERRKADLRGAEGDRAF